MLPYNRGMKPRAQELRRNSTPEENRLWHQFLSGSKYRFTRQKTIGGYIVDFYCPAKKLVIELDGGQHHTADAMEYDAVRTGLLTGLGLTVLRFRNAEVAGSFSEVCARIRLTLEGEG